MAKRKQRSGLAERLGDAGQRAVDTHKDDETTLGGGGDLPAGIEGGIAQLVQCKFDVYKSGTNEGKDYFYAAGIVKQPREVGGILVEGQRTSIMEPLCDTPTRKRATVDDHLAWVLNQLRLLGVEMSDLELDALETVVATLEAEQPHFRFRTWKGDKATTGPFAGQEPRVQHDWRGHCEYEEGEVEDVVDETDTPDESDVVEDDIPFDTGLGEQADAGDEDAQEELTKLAEAAGLDADEYPTWAELADALAPGDEEEEADDDDEEEEEEEEVVPAKGDVLGYTPPRSKKELQVEITAVFDGKRTVNCKDLATGKVFKGIGFDDLADLD